MTYLKMNKKRRNQYKKKPDISYQIPTYKVPIQNVGISRLSFPIVYKFKNKTFVIFPLFDLYVDLPKNMKGINASRTYQLLNKIVSEFRWKEILLEDFSLLLAKKLLEMHEYSRASKVKFRTKININKKTPITKLDNEVSLEVNGYVKYSKTKNKKTATQRYIEITTYGMTVCPCAQIEIREKFIKELKKNLRIQDLKNLEKYLLLSHTQRVKVSIGLEREGNLTFPNFYFFNDILETSCSSSIIHLLKREDEAKLIIHAARNPKFIEDVFREIVYNFWKKSRKWLKNEDVIRVRVESFESIHPHNMICKGEFSGKNLKRFFN